MVAVPVWAALASAASGEEHAASAFTFRQIEPVGVKTGKHARVSFDFGAERIGYVTVRGERIGDALAPLRRYEAKTSDGLGREDVVFHAANSPIDLSALSFECSDGNLQSFWVDCLRLTENKVVAKRLGDEALAARFSDEMKTAFAAAMPKAAENANPLGVIVRQYLGVSADREKRQVEIYPKLVQGMTRMAGTVPTALGTVTVDARHLRGNDFLIDVDVPPGSTARVVTPVWGEGAEVDGKKLGVGSGKLGVVALDGRKRYVFAVKSGKHVVRLVAPPRKAFPQPATSYNLSKIQLEKLDRGVVSVRAKDVAVVSWRYLPTDSTNVAFNVYENGKLATPQPIRDATFFTTGYRKNATYRVEPVGGNGSEKGGAARIGTSPCLKIPLKPVEGGVAPDGESYTYRTEEASVGDVDGDGQYELFVKRSPTNAKDNSQSGWTAPTYIDCVKLDGTHLWRIDLGPNIRSGAHYTQFMVCDFDGDGKAEMICKTADGSVDGTGKTIGDKTAHYANESGRILDGPEFLTVFDGLTGAARATVPYVPARGNVADWGDDYGNRCDRFLACVAYLDGRHPSAVFCRGYYAKSVLAAWDWDGKNLACRWVFDSAAPGNAAYAGQGFHSVRVGDVDFDGKDEIVYGSMVVDDDGTGLYSTGFGHGDGQHLVQASPYLRGLQMWTCHENAVDGLVFRYAGDGKVIWQQKRGYDVPTCVAADFDPTNPGYELWMGKNEPYWDVYGRELAGIGHIGWERDLVWWKGDLLRSRIDNGIKLNHWDWEARKWTYDPVLRSDKSLGGGIKRLPFPILVADILGDWREEVALPGDNGNMLLVYVSPQPTRYRFHTFMHDPVYRLSVAAWNVAYNQATQTGFYFGPDLLGHGIWFRGTYLP